MGKDFNKPLHFSNRDVWFCDLLGEFGTWGRFSVYAEKFLPEVARESIQHGF
jgi:hypothetical protein